MSFIESEIHSKDANFFKREYEVEFISDEGSWLADAGPDKLLFRCRGASYG